MHTLIAMLTNIPPQKLTIATRQSRLALWQAEYVRTTLLGYYPDCDITLLKMSTKGDDILDRSLSKIGGKGLFVKELETALLDGRADLAVHSLKDVPMALPETLHLGAILARETAEDAFVSNHYRALKELPNGAIVGTSSLRRQAALLHAYPHLVIEPLRGNVDTRLKKLDSGEYDAIILAAVGLERLGLTDRIRHYLSPEEMLPAVGQGILAIESRKNEAAWIDWLAPLHHPETALIAGLERKIAQTFGGSCQVPLSALATIADKNIRLRASIATPNGSRRAYSDLEASVEKAQTLCEQVIAELKHQKASDILAQCN